MTPATTCPSCGVDAPAGARFCPSCGARLSSNAPGSTERRIVTTLFADLVGFTALGERHDPEDVDAVLRAYYAMARGVIERFGGTVEKFIGDAVAGVFGAPVAHEDDPERAVRAALAIRDAMTTLQGLAGEPLLVRVAVNTGRAVVRLDAMPRAGEGALVGDPVNTAARLLEAAPPMGVVVGEKAYKLTARTILYEEVTPVAVKGKSLPVRRWLARGAVARKGIGEDPAALTPMIDREVELGILTGLVDKAIASASPQFALIVGEAGIGKSRLVLEFFRTLEARSGFLGTWRQGRCPPYGDGLSFWALREIVSAHAGILQTDSPSTVEEKLERALGDGGADPWLLTRLRPLVGLSAPPCEREENFAAWLQFFEGLARTRPTVLVIEDVHWASDQTLAFLGYLARHASGAPLLALATARPEFLDAHPDVASYADVVTRLHLKSLTEEESGRLASNLPGAAAVPDIAELVFERSGGNPLFTEELVRYVVEHEMPRSGGEPCEAPTSRPRAAVVAAEAPDSITTLIAARLDALPTEHRSLLADAAVVGPVFWPGAVSAMTSRSMRDVQRALSELEAREFVRRHGESVLAGDEEFAFWHALTRDVAYEQLPRAARAVKHAAVARWIQSAAGAREADVADLLAYHCWTAIQLAESLGQGKLAAQLRGPALRALRIAGDRALQFDVFAAEEHYRRAAAIATSADESRAAILLAWCQALHQAGRSMDALAKADEAVDILRAANARRPLAVALYQLSRCCGWVGDPRTTLLAQEALQVAESLGPSVELLKALECRAGDFSAEYADADTIAVADRALELSARLNVPAPVKVIHYRGLARCDSGEESGLADVRLSLDLAKEQGLGRETSDFSYNYAEQVCNYRGPREALDIVREGLTTARRRANAAGIGYLTQAELLDLWLLGEWSAEEVREPELETLLRTQRNLVDIALHMGIRALRDLARGSEELGSRERDLVQAYKDARLAGPYPELDQFCATVLLALATAEGDPAASAQWLGVLEGSVAASNGGPMLSLYLPTPGREAARARIVGAADDTPLQRILALGERLAPTRKSDRGAGASLRGIGAEAEGALDAAETDFAEAARIWREMEIPYERGHALLGRSRCLVALGRAQEAAAPLAEAREIFARLGARPALAETEAVLGRIGQPMAGHADGEDT